MNQNSSLKRDNLVTLKLSLIVVLGSLLTGCQDNEVKPVPSTVSSELIHLQESGAGQTQGRVAPTELGENTPASTPSREHTGDYPPEHSRLPVTSPPNPRAANFTLLEP